jgi:hypothetical protein
MQRLFRDDPQMVVWWGTELECASALTRRERDGTGPSVTARRLERLDELTAEWHEIEPSSTLRRTARRLLRVHPLRAGNALQLAAALRATEDAGRPLPFVCLDERLSGAAQREGFPLAVLG